jgi:uncharacterized membrane protein YkoI
MNKNKTIAIAVLLFGLMVGSLGLVTLLSRPSAVDAAPAARQGTPCAEAQEAGGADDASEANASPGGTGITADEARAAAEAAYPGAKAREVELENENGATVYEVELDNGLEVVLDPATGNILCSGQGD